jgi:hypothetical protein
MNREEHQLATATAVEIAQRQAKERGVEFAGYGMVPGCELLTGFKFTSGGEKAQFSFDVCEERVTSETLEKRCRWAIDDLEYQLAIKEEESIKGTV